MQARRQREIRDALIALAISIIAAAVLVPAYSYSRASGLFPIFIGWVFLALALLEFGLHVGALFRSDASRKPGDVARKPSTLFREIGGLFWLGTIVGLLYLLGFLVATPAFVFAFLRFAAKRSAAYCLVAALITTAFIYIVFVVLLNYQLYAGLLVTGFAR